MEQNSSVDSTDKQYDKEVKPDQADTQIKIDLSDIVLPSTSPPKPPSDCFEMTPYNNELRDNPQKRKNSPPQEPVTKKLCENILYEVNDSSSDTEEYSLSITDVEKNFQIRKYIVESELKGYVDITRNDNNHVKLKFDKEEDYHKVEQRLKEFPINKCDEQKKYIGHTLRATQGVLPVTTAFREFVRDNWLRSNSAEAARAPWREDINAGQDAEVTNHDATDIIEQRFIPRMTRQDAPLRLCSISPSCPRDSATRTVSSANRSSCDSNEDSENEELGTYGLRPEYLEALEITPPLSRWVHVTNFRCDKYELKDVMELAGCVLSCSVVNTNKRFAKVQYSHPLEGVQAVALLHGQKYFGLKLNVCLERNPRNDIILPKGLVDVGIGFGPEGRPIRDVVSQFEKFIRGQKSTINRSLFRKLVSQDSKGNKYNFDSQDSNEEEHKLDEGRINFKELITSPIRSFQVKHVEDLDSTDGVQSEKYFANGNYSPETSTAQQTTPVSCHEVKDLEKSNEINKLQNFSDSVRLSLPDVPGSTIPIRQIRASPAAGFPRPIVAQNLRPRLLNSTSFRSGSSVSTVRMSRDQYPRPSSGNSTPDTGPISVPHPMPNPIGNPPTPGPFGLSQPFSLLSPTGPGPVINPGPVYGLTSMYSPGAISGPPIGIGHRPGSIHGSRPITGPGPVHLSSLAHGPGPQGPRPVQGTVSVQVPGPVSLINPAPRSGSVTGASHTAPPRNKMDVVFANLPPSTTFPFLCEKLAQCGQVMSLKFTTPGCAVASFIHPSHAERCFQNYNGMIVEGYRIVVTLV